MDKADLTEERGGASGTERGRPAEASLATLARREAAVLADEQAAVKRQGTADLREGTADLREETADLRQGAADQRDATADLRQGAADQREETADLRQGVADQREETADLRQGTADQREETADLRQGTADQREETADLRQGTADKREETADLRQETADLRQEAADLRDQVADLRDESERCKAELSAIAGTQLREANERLVVATVHAQTMTEAAEGATAKMAYMAEHDFLTGLPNRALLTDRLSQALALAQRHDKKVAVMYLDLDHFKTINDSLGHAVGDLLLKSAAKRLQGCVRHTDTVSRQGGDEFVVLLSEIESGEDAVLTAEQLIEAMTRPHQIGTHRLHVTLSIGISVYPDDGKDAEAIFKNADLAMYHAKKNGRNNFQVFTSDMNAHAIERRTVEVALHHALEHQGLMLCYQSKVDLQSGAITGAEALLRLRRSDHRLDGPDRFIGIAEDCGLILPIGNWVLREACRQTQDWLQSGIELAQIAVNVSTVEFHSKDFLAGVRATLNDTGLDPHRLELELTESGLMRDTERTAAILHDLKALGVRIAIDDFGTGYSSLSYLRWFPIDTLKIDQSFVHDVGGDGAGHSGEAIVSAVIAMGLSLKLRVVAEGVETAQQLAFLKSQRCAEGQGYYFGQPMPAQEFAGVLAAERRPASGNWP
jgi:diguanylate cyclase (GGDEF)-like protein